MPDFHALAVDEVRHVGDCVAVVLATSKEPQRTHSRAWSSTTSRCRLLSTWTLLWSRAHRWSMPPPGPTVATPLKLPCGDYAAAKAKQPRSW